MIALGEPAGAVEDGRVGKAKRLAESNGKQHLSLDEPTHGLVGCVGPSRFAVAVLVETQRMGGFL